MSRRCKEIDHYFKTLEYDKVDDKKIAHDIERFGLFILVSTIDLTINELLPAIIPEIISKIYLII
jgi:hypothetical protein